MDKHGLKNIRDAHAIEDALHDKDLSSTVMRDELIKAIELKLALGLA